ncbi:hypothetical protein BG844_21295 [Couchioplanes caeruleus subsp. caeruleus]|uniref:Uncharacterized protein n=2 Tax=Couchioplanes caeruleus TaxID=56438 RepID=A0A1K0FHN0_9ACTN|nr:hypothetical protein BG844_21295 [Couchioplanes caeruleus subsp. caeruleus]
MYWTVLSSFAIRELRPGHLSWIHGLSVFTFVTLSVGLWAGYTGHGRVHGRMMAGSYFGLVGAFIGAVAVPQRAVPQMVLHQPLILVAAVAVCLVVAVAIVRWARTGPRRRRTMPRQKSRVEAVIHATATNSAGNQP